MTTQLYVLNSDDSVNWENYRLYMQQKKYNWANTESYYSSKKKWGEYYGYTIPQPYSKEEVDNICREKGTTLPNDLVNYLTKVSSEFFISGYPTQFHLSSIPDKNTCDKINIPITRNCFFDKDFYYIEDDNDVNINEKPVDKTNQFEVEDFSNCMYKISEIGCAFSYNIYLGSGEMNGSVWYYGDDNYWGLTATSLTNFIIENFHKC